MLTARGLAVLAKPAKPPGSCGVTWSAAPRSAERPAL